MRDVFNILAHKRNKHLLQKIFLFNWEFSKDTSIYSPSICCDFFLTMKRWFQIAWDVSFQIFDVPTHSKLGIINSVEGKEFDCVQNFTGLYWILQDCRRFYRILLYGPRSVRLGRSECYHLNARVVVIVRKRKRARARASARRSAVIRCSSTTNHTFLGPLAFFIMCNVACVTWF